MSPRHYLSSPVRLALLRQLADAPEPITVRQMVEHTGAPLFTVRDLLQRPLRSGWITRTLPPTRHAFGTGGGYLYTITDEGRRYLATLTHPEENQ